MLAYLTKYLPFALRFVSNSMMQIHRELDEAAQVAGVPWARNFVKVMLPLLKPGLLAAWFWVMVHAYRELTVALMLARAREPHCRRAHSRLLGAGLIHEALRFRGHHVHRPARDRAHLPSGSAAATAYRSNSKERMIKVRNLRKSFTTKTDMVHAVDGVSLRRRGTARP